MSLSPEVAAMTWPARYPAEFAGLTDAQARSVDSAIGNAVLEGWHPTRADVADQCAGAVGRIDLEEITARARARAPRKGLAS